MVAGTLGADLVAFFTPMRWVIIVVGLVKAIAAIGPWWLDRAGWPRAGFTRRLAWLGAIVVIAWGGVGALSANLVLSGVIHPDGGYDRPGMIGHAWLWDPLFVLWGVALVIGLRHSRTRRCE